MPNDALGGGVVQNINVNIHPDVSLIARQQVMGMMSLIHDAAAAGVADARRQSQSVPVTESQAPQVCRTAPLALNR